MKWLWIYPRAIARLLLFLILASSYFASSLWIHWTTKDEVDRRRRFSRNACQFCKWVCQAFRIKAQVINPLPPNAVGLLVGNHMGFVDILVLCSMMPNLFVTSQEMKETPFLGLITEFGGCVYVERRARSNIMKELADIVEFLRIGFRVVLYPEATSHNGEEILPFKRTLITAAAFAGVPIYPFVFNFKSINGEAFSKKYQKYVCYYGDIAFYESIWNLFKLDEVRCEVEFLPKIEITPDDDRAKIANDLRQMIVNKFQPVQP